MSCEDCEAAQSELHDSPHEALIPYYRWNNANVAIIACDKHFIEIQDVLSKSQTEAEL